MRKSGKLKGKIKRRRDLFISQVHILKYEACKTACMCVQWCMDLNFMNEKHMFGRFFIFLLEAGCLK